MSGRRSYQAPVHLPSHNVDTWLDRMTVELLERTLSDARRASDLVFPSATEKFPGWWLVTKQSY